MSGGWGAFVGTRRRFVGMGVAFVAASYAGDALAGVTMSARASGASTSAIPYLTEPDWSPPRVEVDASAGGTEPGLILLAPIGSGPASAPFGPMIVDNRGEPVWYLQLKTVEAQNLRAQTYRGRPVLTWYEGASTSTYGGSVVIYDTAYHELKRVHGGNGYSCDLHEFLITDTGTALISIYNDVTADLTSIGGPASGHVVEGIVQELDIATGEVVFQWHSLDHVPVEESFRTAPDSSGAVDYFHLNSIGVDNDGGLLVSSRNCSTVYKLDRKTGAIVWRLGGMKSDFEMGPGATFNFQHDARSHTDGTLTLFDNGATGAGAEDVEPESRPLRLRLDLDAMTAELVQVYETPTARLATALGNVQQLPHGGVFVGWGLAGAISEFAPDGTLLFDAMLGNGAATYRAFRVPWTGTPATAPSVVARDGGNGSMTVYASWNGATEVAHWQLRTGPTPGRLTIVGHYPRAGFETPMQTNAQAYAAVAALDARGGVLQVSDTEHVQPPSAALSALSGG
jgi:hypothetical protein